MSLVNEEEFKDKARKHVFSCHLSVFPVVFEMYARSFGLTVGRDEAMHAIVSIIRTSKDAETAYVMFCHYLDSIERK